MAHTSESFSPYDARSCGCYTDGPYFCVCTASAHTLAEKCAEMKERSIHPACVLPFLLDLRRLLILQFSSSYHPLPVVFDRALGAK